MSPSVMPRKGPERRERFRREVLASLGAAGSEIEKLLEVGQSSFIGKPVPPLPMADEPFVQAWRDYAREAAVRGVFVVLREKLAQLRAPIGSPPQGSIEEDERLPTRNPSRRPEQAAIELADPEGLSLSLHSTPAGTIPVLTVRERRDFAILFHALSMCRDPVPESMGAVTICGLNNRDRIMRYRGAWEAAHPGRASALEWHMEFSRLVGRKELYQDRLILLSEGGYSGVPAEKAGMTDRAWCETSRLIRLEHESVHYFTKRAFGSMKNALHDEFIADYAGISTAAGSFRADWLLLFMGLEDFPNYRQGGRLQNYLGNPQPDPRVSAVIRRVLKTAAENVERFERRMHAMAGTAFPRRMDLFLALVSLHMEELASPEAENLIEEALETSRNKSSVCSSNEREYDGVSEAAP